MKNKLNPVPFLILIVLIISISILSLLQFIIPSKIISNPQGELFSSANAMKHITFISQIPHPAQSNRQEENYKYICNRLISIGLTPETQFVDWLKIKNIFARLPGNISSGTILLMAHYDSVFFSPGAGDNAAGTSIVMETIRAIKAGKKLNNDICVLLTDGEERGLDGSFSFMNSTLKNNIKIAINWEGPILIPSGIWRTSPENGFLIKELSRSNSGVIVAPHLFFNRNLIAGDSDSKSFY